MPKSLQLMTLDEFRAGLKGIGYSQERFAELIGYSARTGQKWALGEARIPNSAAILLRLFIALPKALKAVEAMGPVAPRGRAPAKRKRATRKAA